MTAEIDYRNEFKKDAQAYERIVQSKHIQLIYTLEKAVLARVFSEMGAQDKTLMDFACGSGRWTRVLEDCFSDTLGVDVSEQMIAVAREKCRKAQFVVTDITSDGVDQALDGQTFDVITAFRFYKNAQASLRQAATQALPKYLKEDGVFIFDLHLNTFSCMGLLASLMRLLRFPKLLGMSELLIRTMSLADIKRLFKDSEFEVMDYYGMGVLPGRANMVLLPRPWLYKIETFFTQRKILRGISYNILVIARKKSSTPD
ncbi:MAG: class I SAM-dependent methyltransferase [Phycisphaerae bacterium]|nr:class I SAM-dependent methyltransferase [Phycisphaerae bacterium]